MNSWLQKHIDNNFRDFEGLSISGQIPLKDQVLNELLADALRQAQQPASNAPATTASTVEMRPLLKLVKKAEIRAVNGAVVVDFQVGV
ncbi:MAG TPA: hypothetical protein VER03_02900 [Bryobacteraceae bacterium]|nr:hypothetical protein [Bryobacteraceae bacterium]